MVTSLDTNLLLAIADIPYRRDGVLEGVYKRPGKLGRIFIPEGEYELTEQLIITDKSVIIEGEGSGLSTLIWNGTGPAIQFVSTNTIGSSGSSVKGLKIISQNA